MKKVLLLSILLSVAGSFAVQEPKQEARMMPVDELVQAFSQEFEFGQRQQDKLQAELETIATPGGLVELTAARDIALSVRHATALSEKIKGPEEDIVAQFLPSVVVEQLGRYVPLRWTLQFKPGELVREFSGPRSAESLNFTGVRSCANGHYLALEQNSDMASIRIVMWDMLNMKEDEALSYTIFFEKSRPIWDISPEGGMLVYQADESIVGVNLASKKDERELFRKKVDNNVDYLTFSWDGKSILGYTRGLGTIHVWDAATGNKIEAESQALTQSVAELSIAKKSTGGPADYSVLSPGGKKLAIIKNKIVGYKTIEIWDLGTRSLRRTLTADDERYFDLQSCVFDAGGDRIAVITNNADRLVDNAGNPALEVWDLITGIRECHEPQKDTSFLSYANRTAFSPDGLWLVTSFHEKGGFKIWSLPELQKRYAQKTSKSAFRSEEELKSQVEPGGRAGMPIPVPAKRVTVDEFMETLEDLMEESQLDEVRKQLREISQTSPYGEIDEALAQQITDDVLRASAPRELASDDDIPPLEDVSEGGDVEEKEEVAQVSERRLTVPEARKEFGALRTERQRELWNKELNKLAAQSRDTKVDYKAAQQLFAEISSLENF